MTSIDALGTPIGVGATAEVFAHGADRVVKLYTAGASREAAENEGAVLRLLEQGGVAAPRARGIVEIEGRWGLVMTRASGRPFAEAMLADAAAVPSHLDAMVTLQRGLHELPGDDLPRVAERLGTRITDAPGLPEERRRDLVSRLRAMPGGDRLIHGDFHPYNVLGNPDAAVIIDWVDAANGPPQADVCRSYVLMLARVAALAEAYVERYCAVAGWHRNEVEQWLPFVAAGRLCENITDDEAAMLRDLAA